MSIAAIQELIAKSSREKALEAVELISHFVDLGRSEVTLRHESEYWDYKRDLYNLDNADATAELASDVLSFHNTRGGFIICGITKDFTVFGIHDHAALKIDSGILNDKIRGYIGPTFHCIYSTITRPIGGTRKTLAIIFIPPRKGTGIPAGRNAPGQDPAFKKGELFLRVNDQKKPAKTESELAFLYSPAEAEVIVGSRQLRAYIPRPGYRLFQGDHKEFIGKETREPKVADTIDALVFNKWDIVLLHGVGGVGKTAVAIEATRRLESEYKDHFGGIFSISGKSEELTPYERRGIAPEMVSFDQFLHEFLIHADWEGDIPEDLSQKEDLVREILVKKNVLLFIDNYETIESNESRMSQFLKDLPQGVKTLITSRHQPKQLPALPIEVLPLAKSEAQILALTEAAEQRVGAATMERYLDQILEVSSYIPLAIKWIISCSRNSDHLKQLIDEHRRGKPALANLCEFCFTFEYTLLKDDTKKVLALFPLFHWAPTAHEVAVAANLDLDVVTSALDELVHFNLIMRERTHTSDEEVYRILELTASFATTKLRTFADLEKAARLRLKEYYGASIPILMSAAEQMVSRRAAAAARQYIDDEILDRAPDNAKAFYLRGQTFEQEHHYIEAIRDYETAFAKALRNETHLCPEIAFRILSLCKSEPEYPAESIISVLTRGYNASKDVRLASELAKIFEVQGKKTDALEYYQNVYSSYSPEN